MITDPSRSNRLRQRVPALGAVANALRRHWPWLVWLAGPVCYCLGLLGAAASQGVGWGEARWFDAAWFDRAAPDLLDGQAFEPRAGTSDAAGGARFGWGPAAAGALMAAGAGWLLVGAPWILANRAIAVWFPRRTHPGAWALGVNCLALMVLVSVLRGTTGVGRASLLAAWAGWAGLLAWVAWRGTDGAGGGARPHGAEASADQSWPAEAAAVLLALCGVAVAMVWFGREWLLQCHSGDGTEASVLARSLKEHLLPYFEVESLGRPGFVVGSPTLINSYWTCAFQVLLGSSEATARLPFWVWCLAIGAFGSCMLPRAWARVRWSAAAAWGLAGFLWCLWYSFYTGYYPYLADLAAPGVPDALYTLLLLVACDALRREDLGAWVVLMVLASVVLYAGPVMFLLAGAAGLVWQPAGRRAVWRAIAWGLAALAGVLGFYIICGLLDGAFWGWPQTIYSEYVVDFIAPGARWSAGGRYLLCFVLGCGGLGCAGLMTAFLPRRGARHAEEAGARAGPKVKPARAACAQRRTGAARTGGYQRTVATLVLAYLAIVLVSGNKNLHYLGPIILPAVMLWLEELCRWRSPRWAQLGLWATAAGILGAAFLCWPQARPIFTLNRQLGALSTFQARNVWEAYRWARLSEPLYQQGGLSWQVGPHTWVDYAQLGTRNAPCRPLLVSDREPPAGYYLVFRSEAGSALYASEGRFERWLHKPRPAGQAERFPWVFRWLLLGTPEPPRAQGPSAARRAR